ncbi:MAG: Chitinase [Cytophagaceae bacterium]|jgi:chitodextrinase|nr:Chitinase [Cytophagaceae bacterium]
MLHLNQKKGKLLTLVYLSILLTSLLSFTAMGQIKISDDFEENERENSKRRKAYLEQLHRAAPGVDWKKSDEKIRLQKHEEYKKIRLSNKRVEAIETIANGNLTGEWIEKGSNNVAGRIRYADYWTATNTIYAISDGGNLWKADFSGSNWTCTNNAFKIKGAVYLKVVANGGGRRIIVGTEDKKIHYSDNEGATWSQSTGLSTLDNWGWILKTAVAGDAANTVYVLAVEYNNNYCVSVYRSTNKGTSFSKVKSNVIGWDDWNKYSLWAPVTNHNEAYVINPDSVYAISHTASNPVTNLYKHNITVDRDARFTGGISGPSVILYLATGTSLYRSGNKGSSWSTLSAPNSNDPWGWYGLNVSTDNPNLIFWGDIELYKGTYNGSSISWSMVNTWGDYYANPGTKLHADIPAVVSVKNSSSVECQLICTDGGLYTSTNAVSTVSNICLTGMNNSQYYSVYSVRNNLNYVYAGSQDQGIQLSSVDNGGTMAFTQLMSGDNGRTVSTNHNSVWQTGYANLCYYPNAQNGSQFSWYDYNGIGKLWMPYITEHPTDATKVYFGGGITSGDNTVNILQFAYNGSYITSSELAYDFRASSSCDNIASIGISKINNNYWYVLTDNGRLFTSSDGGTNFTIHSTFGLSGHYFYGSAICPSKLQLGTVWIAGSGYSNPGVYKLTNHGQSYQAITNGLPSTMVFDLVANDDESLLFAATEVGPYVYVVSADTWYPMNGLNGPDQTYWDVEFISSTQTVRFATYGRGIWDFKIQTGSSNASPSVSLTAPLNNATYSAPANITVSATAADADGTISKVEFYQGSTLIGTALTSPYSITWNNVAAGSYSITAKAFDNLNASTVSNAAAITVTSGSTCTAAQWNASTAYNTNNEVQYAGIRYRANWWTQNQRPDLNSGGPGSGQPWLNLGTCTNRVAVLDLSPNPVENTYTVNVHLEESEEVNVYIVDYLGRSVADVYKGLLAEGTHGFNLESSTISPGIYHLLMTSKKGNVAVRFIKK